MRTAKCERCGTDGPLSTRFRMSRAGSLVEKLCCGPCAQAELKGVDPGQIQAIPASDPTVCSRCHADFGKSELPLIGGLPFCPDCNATLYRRPLPQWLTVSLAALLLLLAVALMHGRKYFSTEKSLIIGQRLVDKHHYADALPALQQTVAVAPDCEKCILLLAKSELLAGRFQDAYKALHAHKDGHFERTPLSDEVDQIVQRVGLALKEGQDGGKLYKERKWDDAAAKMRHAAQLYPESQALADSALILDAKAAFERKEYDRLLQFAEEGFRRNPQSSMHAASVASALACKYAVTGDPQFRTRSEELLDKARSLLGPTPEEKKALADYEARVRYRIASREIIDTDEYNRRFHPGQDAKSD